jgi:glycosyltransferase involved in cell wall biosynthesis
MSSREEGFPVSILEAMALKCPVISLACPTGPRDLLEGQKRGILVPFTESDPTRLSEAMLTLMKNDSERAAYASESYEYVKQFSAATISTQLFTSLKNLACTH